MKSNYLDLQRQVKKKALHFIVQERTENFKEETFGNLYVLPNDCTNFCNHHHPSFYIPYLLLPLDFCYNLSR